jgi:hypothetical protein
MRDTDNAAKLLSQQLQQCCCCDQCTPIPCRGVRHEGECIQRCVCSDEDNLIELDFERDSMLEDCGQLPDGSCTLAGSEYCDFECLYRNELNR